MDAELDRVLARLCLLREAGGESLAAKTGVWCVIKNRVADPRNRWPKTIHGVITQPFQFSSFNKSDPNVTRWPDEKHPIEWTAWESCGTVVDAMFTADPTDGANFYHDVTIAPPAEAWLGKGKTVNDLGNFRTCQIGRLVFYKIP